MYKKYFKNDWVFFFLGIMCLQVNDWRLVIQTLTMNNKVKKKKKKNMCL